MSLAPTANQCTQILAQYRDVKRFMNASLMLVPQMVASINSSLNSATNQLIGQVDSVVSSYMAPNITAANAMSTVLGDLDKLNASCANVMDMVLPGGLAQSVIGDLTSNLHAGLNQLRGTLGLPAKLKRDLIKAINNAIRADIALLLDPIQNTLMVAMQAYQEFLENSGIFRMMEMMQAMEDCLVSSCQLLADVDRAATTIQNSMNIKPDKTMDFDRIVQSSGLDGSLLTKSFNTYTSKFPRSF